MSKPAKTKTSPKHSPKNNIPLPYESLDEYTCTLPVEHKDFQKEVTSIMRKWGVVVIPDVLSEQECKDKVDQLFDEFETVFPVKRTHLKGWNHANLPHGPRSGLIQSHAGQLPAVWECRTNPRIQSAFRQLYSGLRCRDVNHLVVSQDGINFRPRTPDSDFHEEGTPDWAHLDQGALKPSDIGTSDYLVDDVRYLCMQGQLVLKDSSACFRCSPGSHLIYKKVIMKSSGRTFIRINKGMEKEVKTQLKQVGGKWQIPFRVPAGSLILWSSATIHSAKLQDVPSPEANLKDPYEDLRSVLYICYRPQEEVDDDHMATLLSAYHGCRTTNHWGDHMFNIKPHKYNPNDYHKRIQELTEDPKLMRTGKKGLPISTDLEQEILKLITRQ